MTNNNRLILADGRWQGPHGIGRFASEVLSRLDRADIIIKGPKPLSISNLFWQSYQLSKKSSYQCFFTPGFNPPVTSRIPFAFTIHDLIHLQATDRTSIVHKIYYEQIVKPAIKKAVVVFTVSEYSKQAIIEWAKAPDDKIINVGCGVSKVFKPEGTRHSPGFPYLLHVGNASKPHKNIPNLLRAFAKTKLDNNIKLIFTSALSKHSQQIIQKFGIQNRVCINLDLSEESLASYYRGALGVVFPSTYEGFGLPVLEGMACGVPVLTSDTTSMSEIAKNRTILCEPYNINSLVFGIEELVNNQNLRDTIIRDGLHYQKTFSWDKTSLNIKNEIYHRI